MKPIKVQPRGSQVYWVHPNLVNSASPWDIFEVAADYFRARNLADRRGAYSELLYDNSASRAYRDLVFNCRSLFNFALAHGQTVAWLMSSGEDVLNSFEGDDDG